MMATVFLLCVINMMLLLRGYFEDPGVGLKGRYDIRFRCHYSEGPDEELLFVDWEVLREFVVKEKKSKDSIKVRVFPSVMIQFIVDLQTAYERLNSVDEDTVILNTTLESEEYGAIFVTEKRSFRGREMEEIVWRFALMDVDYSSDIFFECLFGYDYKLYDK